MNKYIVTTTINEPTQAIKKFASMRDWNMIVVGDNKTPHDSYKNINVNYLTPEYQEEMYPELSDAIGWNCIQRRNIGFVEAYRLGADIVATVDDDNIPYDDWGKDVYVGQTISVNIYSTLFGKVFNPLEMTNHSELWHRGFPLERLEESKRVIFLGKQFREILIQADLWDGDPDIDAVCRKLYRVNPTKLYLKTSFVSPIYSPFNSQNTFLHRSVLPNYMVLPHIGRMDDIWGGYITEYLMDTRPLYCSPTVYQERNPHSLDKDFENEVIGYLNTNNLISDISNYEKYLPSKTLKAFEIYRNEYAR